MKNITYLETRTEAKIDLKTGETREVEQTTERTVKVEQEPSFIKLYLQDICKLNDIPKTGSKLLNELLKYTSYDNSILLPSAIKKDIAKRLNTSVGVLDNALSKLTKKGILKRKGTGVYVLNPFFFGKGKWTDIKKIRAAWEYSEEGRILTNVEIEQEIQQEVVDIVEN